MRVIKEMSDLIFKCVDCGNDFTFNEGEQSYYRDRGLAIPKRCSLCRLKRRQGSGQINIPAKSKEGENTN